jgi:hypothetical protein
VAAPDIGAPGLVAAPDIGAPGLMAAPDIGSTWLMVAAQVNLVGTLRMASIPTYLFQPHHFLFLGV